MPKIVIRVRGKIAELLGKPSVICGNSDYAVRFDTDAEWDAYPLKTARFVWQEGSCPVYRDIVFSGDTAAMPVMHRAQAAAVGLYAGDLRTTTPVRIPCVPGICSAHPDPAPDVYAQLLERLSAMTAGAAEAVLRTETVPAEIVSGGEWEE